MTEALQPLISEPVTPSAEASLRRRPRRRPLVWLGAAFFATAVLFVVVVPLLPGYAPYAQDLANANVPAFTDGRVPLGTDALGRDIASRLALGGRTSLLLTLVIVAINLLVGGILGIVAGYRGGWPDNVIGTMTEVQLALPVVLLLMAFSAVIGPNLAVTVVVLGLSYWMGYARIARGIALSLRDRDFVLSAMMQGASVAHVLRRHILPAIAGPLLIVAVTDIGAVMLVLAGLDYLGLGVQPPTPTWGGMIFDGQRFLRLVPSQALLPGLAMFLVVAGAAFISQRFTPEDRAFAIEPEGRR